MAENNRLMGVLCIKATILARQQMNLTILNYNELSNQSLSNRSDIIGFITALRTERRRVFAEQIPLAENRRPVSGLFTQNQCRTFGSGSRQHRRRIPPQMQHDPRRTADLQSIYDS